jgi:hypothetical protein
MVKPILVQIMAMAKTLKVRRRRDFFCRRGGAVVDAGAVC